eukprot:g31613.t1
MQHVLQHVLMLDQELRLQGVMAIQTRGSTCGFCHLPHETRLPSFNLQQRHFLQKLSDSNFLQMILPHIQQRVDESEFHGARELLELLKRELTIRSPLEDGEDGEGHPDVQRTPRNIRYVLERMSLGSLIVLVCAKEMRGHLVMVAAEALQSLRAEVKFLERAEVCKT